MNALVLLHGWGMTPGIFDELRAALRASYVVHTMPLPGYCGAASVEPYTIESLARGVAAQAPERCFVAGWSLGGQVALQWARSQPRQVLGLALIGATPSFVQREDWPHAVDRAVFDAFAESLEGDRVATLNRFASLQAQGDRALKATAQRLRASLCGETDASTRTLRQGLDVLVDSDLRRALDEIEHDTLVVHGENDRLAPLAAGEYLARALKRGRLTAVAGAAHAPIVTHADAVAAALREFAR